MRKIQFFSQLLFLQALILVTFVSHASIREQAPGYSFTNSPRYQSTQNFPVDCPTCQNFTKNNRAQCRAHRRNRISVSPKTLVRHLNSLSDTHFSGTRFSVNPKIALCMWKKESTFQMNAANCSSTARGVGQVLVGTAREALQQKPCRNSGVTWSNSAKSSKAQVFLSMCTLYMKSRGRPVTSRTLERYYGSRSKRRNQAYANSILRCARNSNYPTKIKVAQKQPPQNRVAQKRTSKRFNSKVIAAKSLQQKQLRSSLKRRSEKKAELRFIKRNDEVYGGLFHYN